MHTMKRGITPLTIDRSPEGEIASATTMIGHRLKVGGLLFDGDGILVRFRQ